MIQIVELESVALMERPHVREGVFRTRRVLNGTPGTPGNFALQLGVTPSYYSPRHRHNFDQVRYQLEGDFDFGADGIMKAGTVGYFPEGTHYGPQASDSENSTLVLQFGGASGSGYIAADEYERAAAELAKHGMFAKGVYTRLKADGSKLNKDAYEAVWEQVNGRPLVYPPERYTHPIFIDPASFEWTPLAGPDRVSCKHLGQFSERHTQLAFFKVDPGGSLRLQDNSIYFVTTGHGSISTGNSTGAAKSFGRHASIHLPTGDHAVAIPTGAEPAELLHIGLPRFS
jgi:hypothetical protein